MRTSRLFIVSAALVLMVGANRANAATVTAYELLQDATYINNLDPSTDTTQDLTRTRVNGATTTVETNDATIKLATENNVDDNFGVYNNVDTQYTHLLTWLPSVTYLTATLELIAYDADGNNDSVLIDTLTLGGLSNSNKTTTTYSYDVFGTSALKATLTSDNKLVVYIDKDPNNPSGTQDQINLLSSKLIVTYDDGRPPTDTVPEPQMLTLLGTGLFGIAYGSRRLRRRA